MSSVRWTRPGVAEGGIVNHQERIERATLANIQWIDGERKAYAVEEWNHTEAIIKAYLGNDEAYVHDGELRYSDDGSVLTARECLVRAHEWGMVPLNAKEES